MNKVTEYVRVIGIVPVLILLAGCVATTAQKAVECRNILMNGGFEEPAQESTLPHCYGAWSHNKNSELWKTSLDRTTAYEGKNSVKMEIAGRCSAWLYTKYYAAEPGKTYTISFYSKGKGLFGKDGKDGVGMQCWFFGKDFKKVSTKKAVLFPVGEKWTRITTVVAMPKNAYYITPVVHFSGEHIAVWVDGMQMEKGNTATQFVGGPSLEELVLSQKPLVFGPEDNLTDSNIASVSFRALSLSDYPYDAKKALDGNESTYWAPNIPEPKCPKDMIVSFKKVVTIKEIIIGYYNREQSPTRDGYEIQVPKGDGWKAVKHEVSISEKVYKTAKRDVKYPLWTLRFHGLKTDRVRFYYSRVNTPADSLYRRPAIREIRFLYAN